MNDKPLAPVPCMRRVEPTRTLYAGHVYTPHDQSDIRKRFEAMKAEAKAKEDPALIEQLSASISLFKQRKAKK